MDTDSKTSKIETDNKKPFKIKDVMRNIKKAVVAATLEEIRQKVAERFERGDDQLPTIHLDSDGTEIDDEEYFRTLDENTELIAVFAGEHWIDPSNYVTVTTHRQNGEQSADTTDAAKDAARIQKLVGQLEQNLCNCAKLSDPDLDSLSNMDPDSLVDITGKELMDQLKDSGRPLCAKRNAEDRINLLKLLREGAIFCSEDYLEEAEAIDMEVNRYLDMDTTQPTTTTVITNTNTTTTTITANTTTVNLAVSTPHQQKKQQQHQQKSQPTNKLNKTIEKVQNVATAAMTAAIKRKATTMDTEVTTVDVVTIVEAHASTVAAMINANTQNNNQQQNMMTTAANNSNNNTSSKTNDI
ncbi:DNA fragmentation factor subunit alpha-like [Eurosta solidaginis]|uniref:DNA fragmentation factor subunit alpha-like n=1 Tax=Eurosta solidaginis TaxID=178769 RepID=UPI003530FDF1